jgi:hypothetical protein
MRIQVSKLNFIKKKKKKKKQQQLNHPALSSPPKKQPGSLLPKATRLQPQAAAATAVMGKRSYESDYESVRDAHISENKVGAYVSPCLHLHSSDEGFDRARHRALILGKSHVARRLGWRCLG